MSRRIRLAAIPAMAAIAIVTGGCGSSSSSKGAASSAPTPAATPTTPSTTATAGGRIPRSTAITDPAFRTLLHNSLVQTAHVPANKAPAIEQCVIQALPAHGIKTAGDFIDKSPESVAIINACAKQQGVSK